MRNLISGLASIILVVNANFFAIGIDKNPYKYTLESHTISKGCIFIDCTAPIKTKEDPLVENFIENKVAKKEGFFVDPKATILFKERKTSAAFFNKEVYVIVFKVEDYGSPFDRIGFLPLAKVEVVYDAETGNNLAFAVDALEE